MADKRTTKTPLAMTVWASFDVLDELVGALVDNAPGAAIGLVEDERGVTLDIRSADGQPVLDAVAGFEGVAPDNVVIVSVEARVLRDEVSDPVQKAAQALTDAGAAVFEQERGDRLRDLDDIKLGDVLHDTQEGVGPRDVPETGGRPVARDATEHDCRKKQLVDSGFARESALGDWKAARRRARLKATRDGLEAIEEWLRTNPFECKRPCRFQPRLELYDPPIPGPSSSSSPGGGISVGGSTSGGGSGSVSVPIPLPVPDWETATVRWDAYVQCEPAVFPGTHGIPQSGQTPVSAPCDFRSAWGIGEGRFKYEHIGISGWSETFPAVAPAPSAADIQVAIQQSYNDAVKQALAALEKFQSCPGSCPTPTIAVTLGPSRETGITQTTIRYRTLIPGGSRMYYVNAETAWTARMDCR